MPHTPPAVPAFATWPSFPFEGEFHVKQLDDPVAVEPPRKGEDGAECVSCGAPDDAYIWVSERWRVRAMDRPSGLPMVLILECRSHLDLGDLPNLLAAELGVMTVRLERAVRSLDGVARVHVNRWGDGSAHLHIWFLARPYGRLQLRGTFLSLWDDILPPIPESQWRENLALVAAWLAEFGGRPLAEPPRIQWQAPSSLTQQEARDPAVMERPAPAEPAADGPPEPPDPDGSLPGDPEPDRPEPDHSEPGRAGPDRPEPGRAGPDHSESRAASSDPAVPDVPSGGHAPRAEPALSIEPAPNAEPALSVEPAPSVVADTSGPAASSVGSDAVASRTGSGPPADAAGEP